MRHHLSRTATAASAWTALLALLRAARRGLPLGLAARVVGALPAPALVRLVALRYVAAAPGTDYGCRCGRGARAGAGAGPA